MFVVIVIILIEVLTYYNTTSYLRLHAETPTPGTSKKSPAKKSGGKKKASSGKKAVGVSSAGPFTFILAICTLLLLFILFLLFFFNKKELEIGN